MIDGKTAHERAKARLQPNGKDRDDPEFLEFYHKYRGIVTEIAAVQTPMVLINMVENPVVGVASLLHYAFALKEEIDKAEQESLSSLKDLEF